MPTPEHVPFTSEDFWALPDGRRAELIDGELYDMAPPSWAHQQIAGGIEHALRLYIDRNGGPCKACSAPIAVDLDADGRTWVEPDVLVVCDPGKIGARGVQGAPDFICEVVSPSSQRMDYIVKTGRYERAGVREYWIVDPASRRTLVYRFEQGSAPKDYPFGRPVPVGIFEGLAIEVGGLV